MHKEESVEKSPAKIISINRNKWAIAASVILLSVASYFTMNSANTIENNDSFALDVELEEAFEYFTEYDDIFISEVEELGQIELFNDIDDDYLDEDIDYLLDDITLEDLEELL